MKVTMVMRCLDLLLSLVGDEEIKIEIKNEAGEIIRYPLKTIKADSKVDGIVIRNFNEQ